MKILLIHADSFEYEVTEKAVKDAEPLAEAEGKASIEDALVAFCTVEKEDEADITKIVESARDAIAELSSRVGSEKVVLYPYAHLSTSLSSPKVAMGVVNELEGELRKLGLDVHKSPFGWYKRFTLECKGHPLAESLRSITIAKVEKPAPPAEAIPSEYMILDEQGNEYPLELTKLEENPIVTKNPLLKQFILSEELKGVPGRPPAHVKLMKKLELADYEPASDIGHFRFYPKGALIKRALEEFATDLAVRELGCTRVETPLLYRMDEADIAEQTARFAERDYRFVIDGKELGLRFAGDFGLFKMIKNAVISYKQLPLRVYELSPSFRLEKSGECVGLRRLRAFTMPDVHCFCADVEQALDEFKKLVECYTKLAESMEVDYVVAFRVLKDFYEERRQWFAELVKLARKPALVQLLAKRKHYWIAKYESQFVDASGSNAQLCTVQLDVEDSERYGLSYVDAEGRQRGFIIIHSSMGSIERWIYAMLEQAAKAIEAGRPPKLPLWLSPTQVRIIPTTDEQLEYAKSIVEKLIRRRIRADLDDRPLTLAKKVREGEREWVPYIAVVGSEEREGGFLTVRIRGVGIRRYSLDELVEEIDELIDDKPKLPLPLPTSLSARPKFAR